MANKPLQFVLKEQKLNIGKQAGKTVIVARPTGRHRVDFRNFCTHCQVYHLQSAGGGCRAEPCYGNGTRHCGERRHRGFRRLGHAYALVQEQGRGEGPAVPRAGAHREACSEADALAQVLHADRRNLRTGVGKRQGEGGQETCRGWR